MYVFYNNINRGLNPVLQNTLEDDLQIADPDRQS